MSYIRDVDLIVKRYTAVEKHFFDLIFQFIDSFTVLCRHRNHRCPGSSLKFFARNNRGKIILIQDHYRLSVFDQFHNFKVIIIQSYRAINDIENKIRIFHLFFCAFHTDFFNYIRGITYPRSVKKPERDPLYINLLFQNVSCSTGNVRNNSLFLTNQKIEKRRFPCIRFSNNNRLNPLCHELTGIRRFQKPFQGFSLCHNHLSHIFYIAIQTHMFRIIEGRFDMCCFMQKFLSYIRNLPGNRSFQLMLGTSESMIILSRDNIHHSFRLGQIDPPVEKSSS